MKLILTPSEQETVRHERRFHPHPRIRIRMEVLWLKHLGKSHEEIVLLTELSHNCVCDYLRDFRQHGLEYLLENRFRKPQSALEEHTQTLKEHFAEHPPATSVQAQAVIEELTGIRRCPTQVRQFMKKIGMKPRKTGTLPAKADPEAQEEFKKKHWSLS